MKWFLNLTTRNKLFLGFGIMTVFVGIVIATGYLAISRLELSQQALYQKDFANLRDLTNLRSAQSQMRAEMLEAQLTNMPSQRDRLLKDAGEYAGEIEKVMTVLLDRARDDPKLLSRLEELNVVQKEFAQTRDNDIVPLILAGKIAESRQLAVGVQQSRQEKIRAIIKELNHAADVNARQAVAESTQAAEGALRQFVMVGVAAIVLAVVMTLLTGWIIAAPLKMVSDIAGKVAGGDLTVDIPVGYRKDEVGELLRSFSAMLGGLRKLMREVNDGVGVLASSSGEILATTTQVASGAAETASAVNETTVTVEEVKQTAQLASQKARFVSDSAQKASQVSQNGRKSVEEAMQGMQRIQEQMESIAESIVRLSEQSQAIGEIIATVNDLAEQSNLLAVNAAIEANKAGEQGKGFAVVAQEVKSLAEQSKQATAQVRTILGDIQRATAATVLATEQGNKAVQAGVKQTAETGEAIRLLADSVNEAAQASTQIAASSQQQMVGMDQVALAMENIKQASVQNVSGTRQAEVAARGLHELGQKLQQLALQYKI
ncbi:MAG: methyl-accepting chemotaxis protein [Sulfuriferula sp.]|nr:methyl-accepting chemotaxis protein [Sulfuriferula sp.]